ncbi:valine--tRNA ligase [Pontixanthobacter aestiaquae]|uniref:Valine--tRNA ligase n=1 Tax=Pontixanthobacter aestiaquae TaxID=1509367 RepID=A0A844Z6M3_9SPHN|nr:valine--tRNA ligase [Pontixanthobacter aestiaquae]MDN3646112.1 valine--tRNA ligase [Pontixanthobacter aestiaquae]MXO82896.1 valine--tRNA ligase [Pontixanthobacter aestiaquae]
MTTELSKTFDPASIEARWYQHWEKNGLFRPERPDAQPFTIVNPPPNVTGSLHIGHALDNTLQDIVIRYERLRGKDALWVVGTDHAGIATQMVVERQLEERQDKRTNYSREDFVKKVWEWKEESGGTITTQLRRLGCSMDWSREQFTMDPHFSDAVLKVFVDLYNKGLIYRDKRLVNWDPKLKTAISDLEVETQDLKGQFWHFKYPLADGVTLDDGRGYIEVATTRPETMLADMAVAVHPSDERYASVVGKEVVLPITGRRVPIVADEHADPELGSGAVKITPGHDFNDFEVGKRAGFAAGDMLNMLDGEANVCQTADGLVPDEYLGLHRFKRDGIDGARELVVQRLKEQGFLIPHITKTKKGEEVELDSEPRTIATPFGDRGGVVIEPWLTDQWYVDAEKLAQAPMKAVRDGDIEIIPQSWEKTFFHWMENIQPWCISRQLWWGHRIPVWYGPKVTSELSSFTVVQAAIGKSNDDAWFEFVYGNEADAIEAAKAKYKEMTGLDCRIRIVDQDDPDWSFDGARSRQLDDETWEFDLYRETDVLDTWFSSGLWPFATLGWPDESAPLYQKHYPNDLLISGFDILFFWDARMAMQGMHLTDQAPWKRLYLHGLVRAADGSKMSKSKGNVVDPLGLIDQYGADALRFFMAAMESQGRDIKMDDERVKGYRNFATKLWNATRFCQTNGITASTTLEAPTATSAVNTWIIGEVAETLAKLDAAMADLRFDAAANIIYHFTWDTFCDWYIELIKGNFDEETKAVAGWVLDQILVMLHPFMPFVTEELWNAQGDRANYPLITAKWPEFDANKDHDASSQINWLIELASKIRGAKNELGIAPGAKLEAYCSQPSSSLELARANNATAIERIARLSINKSSPPPGSAMQLIVQRDTLVIPLEGLIDIDAEKARLTKALAASAKEVKSLEGRLDNANFVERAKPEAVEKAKADHAHHSAEVERLTAALARLG